MIFPSLFKKDGTKDENGGAGGDVSKARSTKKPAKKQFVAEVRRVKRQSHVRRSYQRPEGLPATDRLSSYRTILKPLVTEKAADLSERGVYAFLVHNRANAFSVAQAIEAVYGVRPRKVRILRRPARRRQIRTANQRQQRYGFTSPRKKAYVVLKPGDTIRLV